MSPLLPRNLSVLLWTMRGIIRPPIERFPYLYALLERLKNGRHSNAVTPNHDVVIEGCPRSANSFSVQAFKHAQPEPVRVADHLHSRVNPLLGLRWGVPTMVLIREPRELFLSRLAWRIQVVEHMDADVGIIRGTLSPRDYRYLLHFFARKFVNFYEPLIPHREELVITRFSDAIQGFGRQIERLNRKFGTDFVPFEHTEENEERIFEDSDVHLAPAAQRDAIKRKVVTYVDEIDEQLMDRSREVFRTLVDLGEGGEQDAVRRRKRGHRRENAPSERERPPD